jgi:hypothetical protein
MLFYHHKMSIDHVVFGEARNSPEYADPGFREAYLWLEKKVGFYPSFTAVGSSDDKIFPTGYCAQFEDPDLFNFALFSFNSLEGIFIDMCVWDNYVLANLMNGMEVSERAEKLLFRKSWDKEKWLGYSQEKRHQAILVAPSIYLPDAKRIWVRGGEERQKLKDVGFRNVVIKIVSH